MAMKGRRGDGGKNSEERKDFLLKLKIASMAKTARMRAQIGKVASHTECN